MQTLPTFICKNHFIWPMGREHLVNARPHYKNYQILPPEVPPPTMRKTLSEYSHPAELRSQICWWAPTPVGIP